MASLALGVAGAAAGGFLGGSLGASIGWSLGTAAGGALFPEKHKAARLHDLHLQGASYGDFVKILYGTARLSGSVIWETDLQEHTSGGKGGKDPEEVSYSASLDICLTETAIVQVPRFWAAGRLNYDVAQVDTEAPFILYDGNATQDTDPTEEAAEGVGNVPAYRGISRVVFADWNLTPFGNAIPQLSFECVTKVGEIPWRVSTFDAYQGADHNSIQWGGRGGASYADGVVTIYANTGSGSGGTWDEWTVDIYGDPVGSPYNIAHFGMSPMPGDGGLGTVLIGPCINGPQYAAYIPLGGARSGWYVHGVYQHDMADTDDGGNGVEFQVISCMVKGDFIYGLGNGWLKKFALTGGEIPAPAPMLRTVLPFATGLNSSLYKFGQSNDRYIYVSFSTGFSSAFFKFDPDDLSVLETWDAGTTPHAFGGQGQFIVYGGQLVYNGTDGVNYRIWVDEPTEGSPAFTPVGDILQAQGGLTYLGAQGLVLSGDGIVSLMPPPGVTYLDEIVADLCDKAGVTAYDVTALEGIVVHGYIIEQQMTCRQAIETLMPVYFFDAVERDGVITFVLRGGESVVTFEDEDLAATVDGTDSPVLVQVVHTPDADLPSAMNISYMDLDADYQINTQPSLRMVGGSRDVKTVAVPIVLRNSHAKKIVDAWLFNAWYERDSYVWYSSRKYAKYEPTDVATVQGKDLRITNKGDGANGVIEWKGVPSRGANFLQIGEGGDQIGGNQELISPTPTTVLPLDLPLLEDDDSPNGNYVAMANISNRAAGLYKSTDGVAYTRQAVAVADDVIGTCTTALPDFGGGNVFDEGSFLEVAIGPMGGTLASVTRDEAMQGLFPILAGDEVIYARDAELVSSDVYLVSGLLRGRRGTEWAMPGHVAGERFVLLPTAANPAAPYAEIGREVSYKGVMIGASLAGATAVDFTNMGRALRPYAPVHLGGGTDGSGNVTLNWTRRTRIGGAFVAGATVPLFEASEAYIVQIWDASYAICARIIEASVETASYTSAQQVTDFGAQQAHVYFTVGQSGQIGLGTQARGVAGGKGSVDGVPLAPITPYSYNPIISPPPSSGGTRPIDVTLSAGRHAFSPAVGSYYVAKFTTGATGAGNVGIFEFGGPPVMRHAVISTDTGGTNIVAGTYGPAELVSNTINFNFAAYGLSPLTVYYFVSDFGDPASWAYPAGTTLGSAIDFITS